MNSAKEMLKIGDKERAVELLDMCQECVPEENYPLDVTYLGFSNEYMVIDMIETYYQADAYEKALDLSVRFIDQIFKSSEFFLQFYDLAKKEFDACYNCISYIADLSDHYGNKGYASEIRERFNAMLDLKQ